MSDMVRIVKSALVKNARRAYEIGLQSGNGGNLSGRVPGTDLVIIKASGCSFDQCTVDHFVTTTLAGKQVEGDGKPSQELATHLAIYRAKPDVQSVFHTHSPWAIAYADINSAIPNITFHSKSKLGHIPVLGRHGESALDTAKAVEAMIAEDNDQQVFVQARHGIFSFAGTIEMARYNAELVEETAQIAWLMMLHGNMSTDRLT